MLFIFQSCAIVHHVQVGEVRHKKGFVRMPFQLKVSETGIDFGEVANLSRSLSKNNTGKNIGGLAEVISVFQIGPRTGKPVYNERYADSLSRALYKECPSGDITGLVLVREMNSYPVVSGEIIKINGYCLKKKTAKKGRKS